MNLEEKAREFVSEPHESHSGSCREWERQRLVTFASEAVKAEREKIAEELEALGIQRLAFQAYINELRSTK